MLRISRIAFVLTIFLLHGCSGFCDQAEKYNAIFIDEGEEFSDVVDLCVHSNIVFILQDGDIAISSTSMAYDSVERLSNRGVKSIRCNRDFSNEEPILISVDFNICSLGLSVSGASGGVIYMSSEAKNVEEDIKAGLLKKLSIKQWYTYFYSD